MSKFYKTTITFVVLSDEPLEGRGELGLNDIVAECEDGWVAHSESRLTEQVTPEAMSDLLIESGSDPGFFGLEDNDE